MYDYRPSRQNYKAHVAVLALILCALALFIGSGFLPGYAVVAQSLSLILLVPAIQLISRYLVPQYLYRLREYEDGNVDLEIYTYRGGSKMQLVCRIGMEEITAALPLSAGNARAPKGMRRYNYCRDLAPQSALVLSITNADGDCELLLSPDRHLTDVFAAAASKHTATRAAE